MKITNKYNVVAAALVSALASANATAAQAVDGDKPNIVFILTDNLGYGELRSKVKPDKIAVIAGGSRTAFCIDLSKANV
ncbi:MAG TPA: hypothetical protein VN951_04765 [Pyrinomonadaceae bacterium]|nr:hypothetical protein [Pyrinomonadaceae bacterium]